MIDADLQMRFWRNFTDAMFHSTDAALAAAAVWQNDVLAGKTPVKAPTVSPATLAFPFWPWAAFASPPTPKPMQPAMPHMWWLAPAAPSAPSNPFAQMTPSAATSMMSAFAPWADMYWRAFSFMSPNSPMAQMTKTFAPFFPWPTWTWAYMQTPLTSMLMSSGMPYTVASPSARASTCAMDAADAAREQMEKVYSTYRSDGGHAAAQIVALPWTMAASFMTGGKFGNPSIMQIN